MEEKNEEIQQQAEALKVSNEHLQTKSVELEEKNEEIQQQAEALKQSHESLLALDEFKERMLGTIVHDLKNPLNSILGLSETAQDYEKNQKIIHQSGKQMLYMVLTKG